MLLSSVNFVAKTKAVKYKDKPEKKNEKKIEEEKELTAKTCKKCQEEIEEEGKIFRFPTTSSYNSGISFSSSGYNSEENLDFSQFPGDRVNIATGDDLCLTVEQFFYTIGLRDKAKSDSTCIFRKKVLDRQPLPNGCMETVVFALDCDQEFYLTTSKNRDLELNFSSVDPCLDSPDERTFLVYFTGIGHCFIQPKLHKNMYLHHIDQALSIQPLDLNWRCPEEYFFNFSAVPEPYVKPKKDPKVCTHIQEIQKEIASTNKGTTKETSTQELVKTITAEVLRHNIRSEIPDFLPSKKSRNGRRLLAGLLFGCFSAKSNKLTTTEV
ncbi:uncharacterized protein LOC132713009 [Ruditapes philippinarum]|uniref:uncharacterized protein LOC132713009 n=1 Tax=Ruditapes philippinarum TaxID=129788 RepID=UPI00295B2091|nr:uncharacterized protein LOC132713009 [Ruditapes philippinarum]